MIGDYKLPGLPHKLASSTGDTLAGEEQAPRVIDAINQLEHEPEALGVEDQLEQLSIEDLRLNLSKIWKGIKGEKLGSLESLQWREERCSGCFGHGNGRGNYWRR